MSAVWRILSGLARHAHSPALSSQASTLQPVSLAYLTRQLLPAATPQHSCVPAWQGSDQRRMHTHVHSMQPMQPMHGFSWTRSFAAKGAATPAAPKKQRRGDKKLYACRNDKVRSMFEQIWPTMQLTEEELQLFRRNSRVFVTDMGRSIPLQKKYAAAKQHPTQKVPYQDTRSLIYESDLHLDAVGEHPRYLKIRRLRAGNFAIKLQSVRKLRLLMGFSRRYVLQRLYELSRLQPGPDRVWKLICAVEGTLGMSVLRMGLAHDALAARGMITRGTFHVNGVRPLQPRASFVQPGDIISPGPWSQEWHRKYLVSQLGTQVLAKVGQSWSAQPREQISA